MSIQIKDELFKKFYFGIIGAILVLFTSISVFGNSIKKNEKFVPICSITSLKCVNNIYIKKEGYFCKGGKLNNSCNIKIKKDIDLKKIKEENNINYKNNTFSNKYPNIYPSMSCRKLKSLYPLASCDILIKNIEKKGTKKDTKNETNDKNIKKYDKEPDYIFDDKNIKKNTKKTDKSNKKNNKKIIKKVDKKKKYIKKRNIVRNNKISYYREIKQKTKLDLFDLKIDKLNNSATLNGCRYTVEKYSFTDDKKTFATKYIKFLQEIGIVKGVNGKGKIFAPESNITRAEFLKIVLKSLCIDYSNTVADAKFEDIKNGDWISKVVTSALEGKIIKKDGKKFRPNEAITRLEAIKMLIYASKINLLDIEKTSFTDIKNSENIKIVETAKKANIINGQKINGKLIFEPNKKLTRAESAKIIVLLLKAENNKNNSGK